VGISATYGEGRAGGTQVGGSVAGIMHPTFEREIVDAGGVIRLANLLQGQSR